MAQISPERQVILRAAEVRAEQILNEGDVLVVKRCADTKVTVTMRGWDGRWITGRDVKTREFYDDLHAANILAVNGVRVDFTKPA